MSYYSLLIFIVSVSALGLSLYTVHVEHEASGNKNYKALCDINEFVSCTKVFTSKYGTGFGLTSLPDALKLPNGVYGVGFYILSAMLSFSKSQILVRVQLLLSVLSVALSVYLGYVLIFILGDVCVVCIATYALNIINTVIIYKKLSQARREKASKLL